MSFWVIGSIAYLALLLFAFALARVASSPEPADVYPDGGASKSDRSMALSASGRDSSEPGA